jgi:hypothetical protein
MAVSKTLNGVYAFLTMSMLGAGLLTLILSILWRAPNLMRNITISSMDLNAGLALSIFLIFTFFAAVVGILQGNHVTMGLVVLNWILIADAIVVVVVGSMIWFYTLTERNDFSIIWDTQSSSRETLQDMWQCCGYFNGTDRAVNQGFCSNATFAANATGCVTPITHFADYALNNIFTSIYGFMAIIIALFLASLCVIKKRVEAERFRKIDAKRGGRGFV